MRVKLITFGCSANQADSELMAGILVKAGHKIVNNKPNAYLINTCTVKNHTEAKIKRLLKSLKGQRVIVAGCMVNANPELKTLFPKYSFIGVNDCNQVLEALNGESFITDERTNKLCQPKLRQDELVDIIQLSMGCLGQCAYCKTKQAKGQLSSYPKELIIKQAKQALIEGVKELWLTSQDCACYGFDLGTNLVELINELVQLPYEFKVRVGMMNPKHAIKLKGLPELFTNKKIYKFAHLPVQSGSDKVLCDMNRGYTVSDFKQLINNLRRVVPDINVSTDIICGYPTETESDWAKTVSLMQWLRPGFLNISMFTPRQGTPASQLKQLPPGLAKERSRELTRLFNDFCYRPPITRTWVTGRTDYYKLDK
ncbi:MAG: tRNA (N(6)-L-threonylcarbamoyladenosine(37)-C(2))-methylthiotransferase [Candidatus Nanoarchaeia archaeon]|jgi:MiaB-like tRNA modifying enzyme